jgi:cobalt-zinc-cadmium efflux system outer membrane protein
VSCSIPGLGAAVLAGGLAAVSPSAHGQEPLDVERYIAIVRRAHPSAAERAGIEQLAEAERQSARLLPDPVFAFSWDRAKPSESAGPSADETGFSLSQRLPWPGSRSAAKTAADRSADAVRAGGGALAWDVESRARLAFARLQVLRELAGVARAAEEDARSLRDLVARRADLGEARESDRIKAEVEWLRQRRELGAAERHAELAEKLVRALAVEPLPRPLMLKPSDPMPIAALDPAALAARLAASNPALRAARAEARRQEAAASVARRGRVPDLDVTFFRDRELDKEANGFSVGVRVPLWNANRAEIARAEAGRRVAAAAAERQRIDLEAELESRLADLQLALEQAALLAGEVLPRAARSLSLARLLYEEGETSLLDVLDTQRTHRDAQREAAAARLGVALALAEVGRLVGPDFDPRR